MGKLFNIVFMIFIFPVVLPFYLIGAFLESFTRVMELEDGRIERARGEIENRDKNRDNPT